MNDWQNKAWHPAVRYKFGEQPIYLRAQLRPFDMAAAKTNLLAFAAKEQMHNLSAYLIFGSDDFMLVGWAHPLTLRELPHRLAGALQATEVPQEFVVTPPISSRTLTPKQNGLLYNVLNVHAIRAVQNEGRANPLFAELSDAGLIVDRQTFPKETIKFFLTLTVDHHAKLIDGIVEELAAFVRARDTILAPVIHRGKGFCQILLDAQVQPSYYFTIGELTVWLINHCSRYEGRVETYLSVESVRCMDGTSKIDDPTFLAVRGFDPFVASIVPEVYTTISEAADHVIRVLQQEAASVRLSPKNRDLLRDIIKPNLENTAQSFSVPLYIFLAELEAYLRKKLGRVVSYYGLDIREVYNKVGVRNQPDKLTLGDVLQMYSAILTAADQARGHLSGNWESLVELRNKVIHGRYVTDDWPAVLKVLIPQIPRLEELVGHVQTITEPDGTFTYLG